MKLLPCPFCGSEPFEYEDEDCENILWKQFFIECSNQECQAGVSSKIALRNVPGMIEEEIENVNSKWNRRTNKETN